MNTDILTPSALWADFNVLNNFSKEIVSERQEDGVDILHFYIEGKSVNGEREKIYCCSAKKKGKSKNALLLLNDCIQSFDENLAIAYAKKGFFVFMPDYLGTYVKGENFTKYPSEISYANFIEDYIEQDGIEGEVNKTPFYEWAYLAKTVLHYIKTEEKAEKISLVGISMGATVLWQVAGTEEGISSAVFMFDNGWKNYKSVNKHSQENTLSLTDEQVKYSVGVDALSYVSHVACPVLAITTTNSERFPSDRCFDTVNKIDKKFYTAVIYAVNYSERLPYECFNSSVLFLDGCFSGKDLPSTPFIKSKVLDNKVLVECNADKKDLENLSLYAAEETENSCIRSWKKIDQSKEEKFSINYIPFDKCDEIYFLLRAEYKSGYTISSEITYIKTSSNFGDDSNGYNVFYASSKEKTDSVFAVSDKDKNATALDYTPIDILKEKGPMDIEGIYSSEGLLSYKINSLIDKPKDDSILMFDIYSEENCSFTVKLSSISNKTEYISKVSVKCANSWNKILIPINKFKTLEGKVLKSYKEIEKIEFYSNVKYLLNNVLWV